MRVMDDEPDDVPAEEPLPYPQEMDADLETFEPQFRMHVVA